MTNNIPKAQTTNSKCLSAKDQGLWTMDQFTGGKVS